LIQVDASKLRHRVVTTRIEGMATADPFDRQPPPFQ
jgi:hypothetical protein